MESLVERYLSTVNDLLPARQRKDTVTEIRSLIQDALDDRSKSEGREPDDEMAAEVLKQFGPPDKIVAPYLPEKYLIGPRLYPTFLLVLRIALPIIAVLTLVGYWVALKQSNFISVAEVITSVVTSLGNSLSAVIQAFGNIVLIFAILQWVMPEFKLKETEWDPHQLKEVHALDKVRRGGLITEIFFTLVALILVNFYLDKVGIYFNANGNWTFTPLLTPTFKAYVPWFDLQLGLTILLDVLLIRKGAWDTSTRLLSILASTASIAVSASLMTRIPLLYTLKGAMGEFGAEGALSSLLNQVLFVALLIGIVASGVRIARAIWQMLKVRVPLPSASAD